MGAMKDQSIRMCESRDDEKIRSGRCYTTDDEGLDGVWECVWRESEHVTMRLRSLATERVPIVSEWRSWRLVEVCRPLQEAHSDGPILRADFEFHDW